MKNQRRLTIRCLLQIKHVTQIAYLLTPCSIVLKILTGFQLVKKFPSYYRTRRLITAIKVSASVSILSQIDPVHTPKSHFLKIHFNIILPSTPRSPKWSHSFRFLDQNPVYASPLPILYLVYCHNRYLCLINSISLYKSCTQLKTHTSCYNINFLLLFSNRFRFSFPNPAPLSPVPIEQQDLRAIYVICIVCPCCEQNQDCSKLHLQPG